MSNNIQANNQQQLQNNPNLIQMSSFPSFQSNNSFTDKKDDDQDIQQFQVVQNKYKTSINHQQILKRINQQNQIQQKQRQQNQKRRKDMMKKKSSITKVVQTKSLEKTQKELKVIKENQEKMLAYLQKTSRIKQRIGQYCKKYKAMYRPSIYDTKMQKYRFQNKEKLFFYLCYGFQQLKQLQNVQLSPIQQEIITNNAYMFCKKLTFEIDLQMVKILNKNDKTDINRQYKLQFQKLINNLKDDNNIQLKKRILNRQLPSQKIAIANQIQFYTTAKRQQILQKQKRIVAQFTVQTLYNPYLQKKEEQQINQKPMEDMPKQQVPVLKSSKSGYSNKYIEDSLIMQLEELLGDDQMRNMVRRLEEDLKGSSRDNLINHFNQTFHQ